MSSQIKKVISGFIKEAGKKALAGGGELYKGKAVSHYFNNQGQLVFTIAGAPASRKFKVEFYFDSFEARLAADCNCAIGDYPCLHMVAAGYYLLESRELLEELEDRYAFELEEEDELLDSTTGYFEEEDDNEEEVDPQARKKPAKTGAASKKKEKKLFSSLQLEPFPGWPENESDYASTSLKTFNEWTINAMLSTQERRKVLGATARAVSLKPLGERAFEITVSFNKASTDTVFLLIAPDNQIYISSKRRIEKKEGDHELISAFEGAAWLHLLRQKGQKFFTGLINYDKEKGEILKQYGLKLTDPEAAGFEFSFHYGYPELVKKPQNILPINNPEALERMALQLNLKAAKPKIEEITATPAAKPYEIAFLFNGATQQHCHFAFEPFMLTESSAKREVKKIPFKNTNSFSDLNGLPQDIIDALRTLTDDQLLRQATSGDSYYYYNTWNSLGERGASAVRRIYFQWFQQQWEFLKSYPFLFLQLPETKFSGKSILPVTLASDPVSFSFDLKKEGHFVGLFASVQLPDGASIDLQECVVLGGILVHYKNVIYLPKNASELQALSLFGAGGLKIHESKAEDFVEKLVLPFTHSHAVHFPDEMVEGKITGQKPDCVIYLSELNTQFLLIRPVFKYGGQELEYERVASSVVKDGKKLWYIDRDRRAEDDFMQWLRHQHPAFQRQIAQPFVYLQFGDAMKDRWFLKFYQHLHEQDIPVYGMNHLKQFRYNPHPPKIDFQASSGVDWFDLQIEVSFGDQHVSLRELRKALAARQPYVLLGDGSIGLLPEDWLAQYGLLLSYAQPNKESGKEGALRLSKLHFTLLENLPAVSEQVEAELRQKKDKLKEVENVEAVKVPKMKEVSLRPYQKAGFQWMNVLHQLGWGGCLADDMGLGKTLQTLTFLTSLQKEYPQSTHLIVCPTSLLFNWEAEINKYAPWLSYHIYYGSGRDFTESHFAEFSLVLTSYGTLRNDIGHLMKFPFHYVILDESQTIKNPNALTTKTTLLLQAKNRLILSGTPLQNNTGDLYAQFNFLNPGMLGSYEHFKNQFGTPIDRNGDKEASALLRKIIYPFLLRRTKEQVASDLPHKTEMVLYMDMGKEQAKIYDAFKEHYRNALLGRIEKEGVASSTIYILEGLTKLRQICNSPALLSEEEQYPNESIKLEELFRELKENLGTHKGLVFSQFTGMLQLIREKLEKEGVLYEYLDGSTPAAKRKAAVRNFQENNEVRVFLISLKAGGVGLNLTAADYVYLVDPWWNPAAEQQAIDRTHRIGQDKKIFAYKMICKDTVEEKVLELQKRKLAIATEIISEESSFIKKLSKEDVEWLFS